MCYTDITLIPISCFILGQGSIYSIPWFRVYSAYLTGLCWPLSTYQSDIWCRNFQVHATSSGLKALSTDIVSAGIETCRLSCGGHGYSLSSGIPKIYTNVTAACTYEGENTVLYLQTARQASFSIFTQNIEYILQESVETLLILVLLWKLKTIDIPFVSNKFTSFLYACNNFVVAKPILAILSIVI